ncbi:MAG: hypothetical protein QME96_17920, partial [Myxococcota bacterium]|nr:hypothetical protein [Myxococcota bacterium]
PGDVPVEGADVPPGDADAPADDSGFDDVSPDAAGCEPQDAAFGSGCRPGVYRWVWNGRRCVGVDAGLGCECVGADCDETYSSVEECVAARRRCYDVSCAPQVVSDTTCEECDAYEFQGAFWNGRECFEVWGCGCVGEGCGGAFDSEQECRAVHAGCDGALCRAGGGMWFPASACFCNPRCGPLSTCRGCMDSCVCPPGWTFGPGAGCAPDPSCTPADLCRATRGAWHPASECICGFRCGRPGDCDACLDSCDCGPHRNFDPAAGCLPDPACDATDQAGACAATGGTWRVCGPGEPCSCGHYSCGIPNTLDPCVVPGCDCGPHANFDEARGCVLDDRCALRGVGDECTVGGFDSTCRPGLACCPWFTGEPPIHHACVDPCCPDLPACRSDGCYPIR